MVTLEELLEWLRAPATDAEQIEDLLEAAVAHVENETGMRWGTAGEITETVTWQGWPLALRGDVDTEADLTLERWTGEAWEAMDASSFYADGAFLRPATTWEFTGSAPHRYRVTYTTGYTAGLQPAPVRLAVKKLVQMWYDGAEGETLDAETKAVDRLLAPYRRVAF